MDLVTSTADLGLATYVLCIEPKAYAGSHRKGAQVFFEFDLSREAMRVHAADFVSRRGLVSARDFFENMRALKEVIYG
jgi:hypothetical protein